MNPGGPASRGLSLLARAARAAGDGPSAPSSASLSLLASLRGIFTTAASSTAAAPASAPPEAAAPSGDRGPSDPPSTSSPSPPSGPALPDPSELEDPSKAHALLYTKGWWQRAASARQLAEVISAVSTTGRVPASREALIHLYNLVSSPEELELALQATRLHRKRSIMARVPFRLLQPATHGGALMRAALAQGGPAAAIKVIERLAKLGFAREGLEPMLEPALLELAKSGDTLAIFRCLLALEKQELAETAEFGKLFADAFAAAGRDDLAEVVKAEWESEVHTPGGSLLSKRDVLRLGGKDPRKRSLHQVQQRSNDRDDDGTSQPNQRQRILGPYGHGLSGGSGAGGSVHGGASAGTPVIVVPPSGSFVPPSTLHAHFGGPAYTYSQNRTNNVTPLASPGSGAFGGFGGFGGTSTHVEVSGSAKSSGLGSRPRYCYGGPTSSIGAWSGPSAGLAATKLCHDALVNKGHQLEGTNSNSSRGRSGSVSVAASGSAASGLDRSKSTFANPSLALFSRQQLRNANTATSVGIQGLLSQKDADEGGGESSPAAGPMLDRSRRGQGQSVSMDQGQRTLVNQPNHRGRGYGDKSHSNLGQLAPRAAVVMEAEPTVVSCEVMECDYLYSPSDPLLRGSNSQAPPAGTETLPRAPLAPSQSPVPGEGPQAEGKSSLKKVLRRILHPFSRP